MNRFEIDDDNRWLIAMIADTGMRLSEAVGLLVDDIKLDATTPHYSAEASVAAIEDSFKPTGHSPYRECAESCGKDFRSG